MKMIAAIEPSTVETIDSYEVIDLAADLNKPIYGPSDIKETYRSKDRIALTFYFPMSEKDKDYAMLILFEDELDGFYKRAKEKGVKVIPIYTIVVIGEMVHGVDE